MVMLRSVVLRDLTIVCMIVTGSDRGRAGEPHAHTCYGVSCASPHDFPRAGSIDPQVIFTFVVPSATQRPPVPVQLRMDSHNRLVAVLRAASL